MAYKILIISSRPPEHSADLGISIRDALQEYGHEVDFLTVYDLTRERKKTIAVYPRTKTRLVKDHLIQYKVYQALHDSFHAVKKKLRRSRREQQSFQEHALPQEPTCSTPKSEEWLIFYPDENHPDVPPEDIIKVIRKKYDAVITLFWQDMLNSTSLLAIFEHLKCPILILSVDMAPITGGCFYFGRCEGYKSGCGRCPGLESDDEDDQSHKNYLIKKKNYAAMNCAFLGNTWMNGFALESGLFEHVYKCGLVIDKDMFCIPPRKSDIALEGIDKTYDFLILLRSSSEPRKGNRDLHKALSRFITNLEEEQRTRVGVLCIGSDYFASIANDLQCDVISLGTVDTETLIKCYQISDIFLNASYDDAGPSMINQSLMCGTPVVCYDNGVAIDLVDEGVTGFKTKTGDWMTLSDRIMKAYNLNETEKQVISGSCRKIALEFNSALSFAENITAIIRDMKGDTC